MYILYRVKSYKLFSLLIVMVIKSEPHPFFDIWCPRILTWLVGVGAGIYVGVSVSNTIPENDVKRGYVVPRDLSISVRDWDEDGRTEETIMGYKGKNYLLQENERGVPTATPYEIRSDGKFPK